MARLGLMVAICALASVAHADRVHLVSGAVIEGKATRAGDRVMVEVEAGQIGIPADEVVRIEPGSSPVQRVEEGRAQLEPGDVAGRISLANYCRDHGMRTCEQQLLREVVDLSPDHAVARARLGYVRKGDSWALREQDLRERGLVQHEGRWSTPAQVLELERLRAQAETAAHERDKAKAELEAKQTELEIRKREAAATADVTDDAAQAAAQPPAVVSSPVYFWPAPHTFIRRHDHVCPGPRCPRRAPAARPDGRPPWPIVGTRDPFDYLR